MTKISIFLDRIKTVNEDSNYLFKVESAIGFGSYFNGKPAKDNKYGDIDIRVVLQTKKDNDEHWVLSQQKTKEALKGGRRFSNLTQELSWSHTEVMLFLKNKSAVLSVVGFVNHESNIIKRSNPKLIFGQPSEEIKDCLT